MRGTDHITGVRMNSLIKCVIGRNIGAQEDNAMKIQKEARSAFYSTPWGAVMAFMNSLSYYEDIDHHTEVNACGGMWHVRVGSIIVFKAHYDCDGGVFCQFC